MDNFDMNEEEFPKFEIPESTLMQFFELTGRPESHKGFVLAYVNEEGCPVIFSKTDSQIVDMGLQKALGQFLEESAVGRGIEFPPTEET